MLTLFYPFPEMCLITSNPYDFPLISMGVITVASIDDKAELDATDVSEPVFSSTNCHLRNVQNIYPVHFYCMLVCLLLSL